jgi:hypothetical protein
MDVYKHRKSVLEAEKTYALDADGLAWSVDGSGETRWSLKDIVAVNLRFDPTRFETARFKMVIRHKSGKSLTLSNMSYQGIADFDDRSGPYLDFVRALHVQLTAQNSMAEFSGGISTVKYMLHWVFTGFVVLVLIAASVWFFTIGLSWLVLIKLLIIGYYFPTLIAFMRRAKPTSYQPDNVPASLLPTG